MKSGLGSGRSCSKLRDVSPGSGRNFGAGIGLGIGPILGPAVWTWVIVIVGFPPFFLTSSSLSHKVLPDLTITSTPASLAAFITAASRSRAYASVSFSKTKCVIFHALKSFGKSVWGASRMRNSFDFLLRLGY